ncbi:hypothetical protein PsorP6_014128 [Peronosclerospora sorghi]|uniref:Uncharacterized protein n=1 Tax=Peronosclerospora sorghi TaxID=230839 RepID=A0ACC0VGN1_9STRA|nr:hypothetical protein PsorP6_014128 [Peronosclerospora sorghi]
MSKCQTLSHVRAREDQLFQELLWSDPRLVASRQASERGAGVEFGVHVTNHFSLVNHLALILRSHECVLEGYEILHGGRLITLFSASRYCGTQMNKGAFLTLGPELDPAIQQFYAHAMHESTFGLPAGHQDATAHDVLEDETLRMLAERICDAKAALYWYFTQHELERDGTVPRCVWADALRTVLQLELPFLTYQAKLADVVAQDPTRINYSQFLARYRIENEAVDPTGWQERILARICQKLYRAMGAGDLEAAFHVFDTDASGFIEYTEFVTTLKRLDTGLSDQQVFAVMRTADTNDDGRIDFHEFAHRRRRAALDAPEEADAPLEPIEAVGAPVRTHDVRPLDLETRHALVQIGQALFARGGSLHDHFYHLDTNHDGVLSRLEFQAALADLGFAFGQDVLDRVLAAVDRDGGHSIDYNEFVAAFRVEDVKARASGELTWQHSVLHHVANVLYQHRVPLCHAFRLFDPAHRGVITRDEFRTGMQTLNAVLDAPLSDDQMDEVVAALDRHEDVGINYKDFLDSFRVVDVVGHVEEDDDEAHDERKSKHGRACPPCGAGSRT